METEPWNPPPWEPPFRGTEVEALFAHLDRQRVTFRWKAGDLDEPMPEPWTSVDQDAAGEGWEWRSAVDDSAADLYALYDAAADRSRALVAAVVELGGLDAPSNVTLPDGSRANIRRLVLDVVEEYGRHVGHADLLREAVDGRTGEDPPWPTVEPA